MGKLVTKEDIENGFNWEEIEKEIKNNIEENEEGEREGLCFIGTVFNLSPSGKYYQPFACSNVDICPKCKGEGSIKNPFYNKASYERARENDHFYRMEAIMLFGPFCNGKWLKAWIDRLDKTSNTMQFFEEKKTCPYCEGLGSREAYEDSVFYAALEEVASEKGFFVTSGIGCIS